MASVPCLYKANYILIVLIIQYLRLASSVSPPNLPQFTDLTILNKTDESSTIRIVFEVRGNNIFKGLQINATKNKAEAKTPCTDADEWLNYNISEISAKNFWGRYEISVPNELTDVLYFCVSMPSTHLNDEEFPRAKSKLTPFAGPYWYHQGPNVSLSIGSDSPRQE